MSVGLVLVAHSAWLAAGAAEVAREMGLGAVRVEPAGGGPDGDLGTSPDLVADAVARANDGDGVLLLADIGSSVLTAQLSVDEGVELADAPLVEGAVAAASAAAAGKLLDGVKAAAEEARAFRKLPEAP